ncbi:MAG: hypothetical protein LC672_01050, partial [Acidobacteria bacterium]|nr:hypothetical protein [Acidobacteriota bacterium]
FTVTVMLNPARKWTLRRAQVRFSRLASAFSMTLARKRCRSSRSSASQRAIVRHAGQIPSTGFGESEPSGCGQRSPSPLRMWAGDSHRRRELPRRAPALLRRTLRKREA